MGLDRDRILAKARERGSVKPAVTPTEQEIFALVFAPGFSTAEIVTDVSGRGVGMDVVRRNIEKLRGKVEIQSVGGHSTTFTIVLPPGHLNCLANRRLSSRIWARFSDGKTCWPVPRSWAMAGWV